MFTFSLKFPWCSHDPSMLFSRSFCRITTLSPQVSSISVMKLSIIYCAINWFILHIVSAVFPLFSTNISCFLILCLTISMNIFVVSVYLRSSVLRFPSSLKVRPKCLYLCNCLILTSPNRIQHFVVSLLTGSRILFLTMYC